MAPWEWDINTDPNCIYTMDPDMANSIILGPVVTIVLGGSAGLSYWHGSRNNMVLPSTMTQGRGEILAAVQLSMVTGAQHEHRPWLQYSSGHRHGPWPQLDSKDHYGPKWYAGHPNLYSPGNRLTLRHQHGLRCQFRP